MAAAAHLVRNVKTMCGLKSVRCIHGLPCLKFVQDFRSLMLAGCLHVRYGQWLIGLCRRAVLAFASVHYLSHCLAGPATAQDMVSDEGKHADLVAVLQGKLRQKVCSLRRA